MLADGVYQRLRALIMSHGLAPGARVTIDEVARELEVSGTPVREALARLESEGLVDRLPLRGYRTTPLLTRAEVADLYGLRLLLEPPSAFAAAKAITPATAAELAAELAGCPSAPADYQAISAHDTRFHRLILRLAGNAAVAAAFDRTHCHLHLFRLSYRQPEGELALAEHRGIAAALAAGQAVAARKAMAGHLEAARDRLLARF